MRSDISRRGLIKGMATTALAPALLPAAGCGTITARSHGGLATACRRKAQTRPRLPAPSTSPTALPTRPFAAWCSSASITCSAGGPALPWTASELQPMVDKLKASGVTLGNLMIGGFPNTIYGRPGRDEEIEKIRQSIQAAGQVGHAGGRIQLLCAPGHGRLLTKKLAGAAPD